MLIRAYLDAEASPHTLPDLENALATLALRKGHRISEFFSDHKTPQCRDSLFRLLKDKGLAIASQVQPAGQVLPNGSDQLFRLLQQSRPNDVLLMASTRTLSNLSDHNWQKFRQRIRQKKVRVVTLDVEASWVMITSESAMAPIAEKLTAMMLDTLEVAPGAPNDQKQNRHLEGIARAKARGKYKGRPVNQKKHQQIRTLLDEGYSWSEVCAETGASRSTVARVVKAGNR